MADQNMMDELFDSEMTEKQKQIVVAAIDIFAEKGFAATSTNEIAKKAGVAEGTIFRHWKTKKDLLLSIVSPMMVKMLAPFIIKDLNKVLDQEYATFEDFVRAMVENRQKFLEKNMSILKILLQEIPFHPELRELFIEHVGKKVLARFIEIIEHYQSKGQLADLPATTVVRLAGSTILGYFATKYVIARNSDSWEDDVELERTIRFLVDGLAKQGM
ncbi:TetR/AcrR family transcriptional regulator [Sporosarcina sp. FSL W7-1349]|uniref:TetR/AcrR family transcriptional regulator n=1 Tax=Bacillales TaxID=1385 RepID=UPI000581E941|nr:TetR/AcrR family transcriptional regulator [Bacillus sp. OxB-1]BAQ10156.1 transcriptional regulator, tetr family protein [Bacillus sp. OxB-1]